MQTASDRSSAESSSDQSGFASNANPRSAALREIELMRAQAYWTYGPVSPSNLRDACGSNHHGCFRIELEEHELERAHADDLGTFLKVCRNFLADALQSRLFRELVHFVEQIVRIHYGSFPALHLAGRQIDHAICHVIQVVRPFVPHFLQD